MHALAPRFGRAMLSPAVLHSLGASLTPQRFYQPLDLRVTWCQRRELFSIAQRGLAVAAFLEIGHQGAQDIPVGRPLPVGLLEHGNSPGRVARAVQGHCEDIRKPRRLRPPLHGLA